MSSNIVDIPDEDVENRPPLDPLSSNGLSISNTPTVKRNNYIKQRGRRRRWWYFNRGLQPISEAAEIKDDAVKCENNDDSSISVDDTNVINDYYSADNPIISSNSPQNKEGYSACLKVIEKFQEVVMDSAVRVIQAAFKRFRERRRFLRIKKAVMVIQRNLRKWLESKHPCIRPANFERQSSDCSKSDEYRETVECDFDGSVTEEKDQLEKSQATATESEKWQENNDRNENSVENPKINEALNTDDNVSTQDALVVENVNTEFKLKGKSEDYEPNNNCLPGSDYDEKLVPITKESKENEIISDVKSLMEELLLKVTSSLQNSNSNEDQVKNELKIKEFEHGENDMNTTNSCALLSSSEKVVDSIQAQGSSNKTNIGVEQDNLNNESDKNKISADDLKEREEHTLKVSPDSLKVICQDFLNTTVIVCSNNMKAGS